MFMRFVLWLFALFLGAPLLAMAQPSQLIFSKDAIGPILPGRMSLELRSNPASDATKQFFPDGSQLVSDDLALQLDRNGVGSFSGTARIKSASGETLLSGRLHGVVGLTSQRRAGQTSTKAGNLEGVFEANEASSVTGGTGAANVLPPSPARRLITSFVATRNLLVLGPNPVYQAHLDGILSMPPAPPPVPTGVSLSSDSATYFSGAPITAIIKNATNRAIYADDLQSICTIVQLQKREGSAWLTQYSCALARPPIATKINAGQTLRVELKSAGLPDATPGAYRLALTFGNSSGVTSGSPLTTVYSSLFRIIAKPLNSGSVTVTPNKKSYQSNDVIVATIENGTDFRIQTRDHQSFCSILTLMRRTGTAWQAIGHCELDSPTQSVVIKAGAQQIVSLPEVVPAIFPPPVNFEPGDYRLDLSYVLLDEQNHAIGNRQVSSSAVFAVVGSQPPLTTGVRGKATEKLFGGAAPPPDQPPFVLIRPLPGAIIILTTPAGREVARSVADKDGLFRIYAQPGTYQLVGKRPNTSGLPEPAPVPITIAAGRFTEANLEFITPLP